MQKQRIILLVSGLILAAVAIFFVNKYLEEQRSIMKEQTERTLAQIQSSQTGVLVAKKDIPRGAVINVDMFETAIVPNQYVQPQAVTSLDRIAGMITIAPISQGEQITLNKLLQPQQAQAGSLAMATPVGKRATTVSVDNVASLVGMIKPGDYVDMIVMLPVPVQTTDGKTVSQIAVVPLFQNVLVLAVGRYTGTAATQESRYYQKTTEQQEVSPLITLALAPQEASLIVFVQEQAKIRLILRSPADSQIEQIPPTSWDTLFQYLMPKQEVATPEPEPETPTEYVEIYRGLNRERVPLSK